MSVQPTSYPKVDLVGNGLYFRKAVKLGDRFYDVELILTGKDDKIIDMGQLAGLQNHSIFLATVLDVKNFSNHIFQNRYAQNELNWSEYHANPSEMKDVIHKLAIPPGTDVGGVKIPVNQLKPSKPPRPQAPLVKQPPPQLSAPSRRRAQTLEPAESRAPARASASSAGSATGQPTWRLPDFKSFPGLPNVPSLPRVPTDLSKSCAELNAQLQGAFSEIGQKVGNTWNAAVNAVKKRKRIQIEEDANKAEEKADRRSDRELDGIEPEEIVSEPVDVASSATVFPALTQELLELTTEGINTVATTGYYPLTDWIIKNQTDDRIGMAIACFKYVEMQLKDQQITLTRTPQIEEILISYKNVQPCNEVNANVFINTNCLAASEVIL